MASDFIMRLVQKKLLDKNYQVTAEEIYQSEDSLSDRIHLAQLLLTMLMDEQKILVRFIDEAKEKGIIPNGKTDNSNTGAQ